MNHQWDVHKIITEKFYISSSKNGNVWGIICKSYFASPLLTTKSLNKNSSVGHSWGCKMENDGPVKIDLGM